MNCIQSPPLQISLGLWVVRSIPGVVEDDCYRKRHRRWRSEGFRSEFWMALDSSSTSEDRSGYNGAHADSHRLRLQNLRNLSMRSNPNVFHIPTTDGGAAKTSSHTPTRYGAFVENGGSSKFVPRISQERYYDGFGGGLS